VTPDPTPAPPRTRNQALWTGTGIEWHPAVLRRAALALLLVTLPAVARAADHTAYVRGGTVFVNGEARWSGAAVISDPAWSPRGDALAFTARDGRGRRLLVVVLVDDDKQPTAFSWPVPRAVGSTRAVSWLGDSRVGAGASALKPSMIVEFTLD
jgi:hypothetical protein